MIGLSYFYEAAHSIAGKIANLSGLASDVVQELPQWPKEDNEALIAQYFPRLDPSNFQKNTVDGALNNRGDGNISFSSVAKNEIYTKYYKRNADTGVEIARDATTEQMLYIRYAPKKQPEQRVTGPSTTYIYFSDRDGVLYEEPLLIAQDDRNNTILRGHMRDGKFTGRKTDYHENGAVKRVGTYVDDALHGIQTSCDENRCITAVEDFEHGISLERTERDPKTGKPIVSRERLALSGDTLVSRFNDNGALAWQGVEKGGIVVQETMMADDGKTVVNSTTRGADGRIKDMKRLGPQGLELFVQDGQLLNLEEILVKSGKIIGKNQINKLKSHFSVLC